MQTLNGIRSSKRLPLLGRVAQEGEEPRAGFFQAVDDAGAFQPPFAHEGFVLGLHVLDGFRIDHVRVVGADLVVQLLWRMGQQVAVLVQHLLPVAAHAERDQQRQPGGALVETNPNHRAIEDETHDVVLRQVAFLPSFPIGLHLVPSAAHDVFADGAAEPRARYRYRDRAKGPDQLALTVAVAMPMRAATTIIAATLQGGVQFPLQHRLDEAANSLANRPFQRIEPILTPEWLRLGGCDSLFHGVISWRLAGRPLGCIPIRRLRRLQIPTTSATRPIANSAALLRSVPPTRGQR